MKYLPSKIQWYQRRRPNPLSKAQLANIPFEADDVRAILKCVPPRPSYEQWIRVIASVASVLPKDVTAEVLNEWSPEEKAGEYAAKLKYPLKKIGIGSLIQIAKQHGYDVKAEFRKRIRRCGGKRDFSNPANPLASITAQQPNVSATPLAGGTIKTVQPTQTLRQGTYDELYELQNLRKLPKPNGLVLASRAGILRFAEEKLKNGQQVRMWAITDSSQRSVLYRRMDGHPFGHSQRDKARFAKGSDGQWPIGISQIGSVEKIALVEGGPDLLALFHLISEFYYTDYAPVAMPSGSAAIAKDALPAFRGREVLIFAHNDKAGRDAYLRWRRQLLVAGACSVMRFNFSHWMISGFHRPPKDLNNYVEEEYRRNLKTVPGTDKIVP